MDIFEAFARRRSVRKFSGAEISAEALDRIISAGLSSPSGRGKWPCELISVRDRKTLDLLSQCKPGTAKMLADADCAIAVIADETRSDTWIEDASIVMSNLHLAAAGLGLGSCWVQCRGRKTPDGIDSEEYVRGILNFPREYRLLAILALGVPAEEPECRDILLLRREKLHSEKY